MEADCFLKFNLQGIIYFLIHCEKKVIFFFYSLWLVNGCKYKNNFSLK